MVRMGLSNTELAAATDLSITTINDALNPARDPPSADVLNGLAAALNVAGPALTHWGVLRDRADPRNRPDSPHLLGYLRAARHSARHSPYPGVVPGVVPPPPTVYVSQFAQLDFPYDVIGRLGPDAGPVAADAILGQECGCAVLAEPGCGKSTLLRVGLAAMADRWLADRRDTAVPVLLDAVHLTGKDVPLPEALAAGVSADLSSAGLAGPLPDDFFRLEPRPGIPWLVLIDGLDEIVDPAARRRVFAILETEMDGPGSPYRFVVAARSLSLSDSYTLARTLPTYRLWPFTPDDLSGFAARWFTVLGSPDPEDTARSFTNALKQAHLTDLACTPLVATMLCQLYAAAPDRQLPSGRSNVYLRFTELLQERHLKTGIDAQTSAALQRHGDHVVTRARHTFNHLRPMLANLATQRRAGNTEPTLNVLTRQPDATCPVQVPPRLWTQFLGEILQCGGLMALRADDFAFLHQTFLDYLAVEQIAADQEATVRESSALFDRRWTEDRYGSGPGFAWTPPTNDDSFLGFLLDAWRDTPADPARALQAIATRGGPGCAFITTQTRLGTLLPASLVATAADALACWAEAPVEADYRMAHSRCKAAEALAAFGDPRGPDLLAAMASNTAFNNRFEATRALAKLGDPRGRDALALIATDPGHNDRFVAMHALADVGDTRGPDLMATVATDPAVDIAQRNQAVKALAELSDPRGPAALAEMAADPGLDGPSRRRAAEALATSGDPRGSDALVAMAADPDLDDSWRRRAAVALADFGDLRGLAALAAMATDPNLDNPSRRRAAEGLAALGDRRGLDVLAVMAADLGLDNPWRRRATEALAEFYAPEVRPPAAAARLGRSDRTSNGTSP